MKYYIALFFLINLATFQSCIGPRLCCAPPPGPKGYNLYIAYKTKDGKNLFPCPYDTSRIKVYQVITKNNIATKEPLALPLWGELKDSNNPGCSSIAVTLPTADKRISRILICFHPDNVADTISYQGEGPNNYPKTKNVFYNGACIEQLKLKDASKDSERVYCFFTVTKP